MLDIKLVRNELEKVRAGMAKRGIQVPLDQFINLDEERRRKLTEVEQLKNKRNTVSKEVGKLKAQGQDATGDWSSDVCSSDLKCRMLGEKFKN